MSTLNIVCIILYGLFGAGCFYMYSSKDKKAANQRLETIVQAPWVILFGNIFAVVTALWVAMVYLVRLLKAIISYPFHLRSRS